MCHRIATLKRLEVLPLPGKDRRPAQPHQLRATAFLSSVWISMPPAYGRGSCETASASHAGQTICNLPENVPVVTERIRGAVDVGRKRVLSPRSCMQGGRLRFHADAGWMWVPARRFCASQERIRARRHVVGRFGADLVAEGVRPQDRPECSGARRFVHCPAVSDSWICSPRTVMSSRGEREPASSSRAASICSSISSIGRWETDSKAAR
jgi:hypothetical protein